MYMWQSWVETIIAWLVIIFIAGAVIFAVVCLLRMLYRAAFKK